MRLEDKIGRELWNIICAGSGDGDSIKTAAKKLAEIAYRHQRSHPLNMRSK